MNKYLLILMIIVLPACGGSDNKKVVIPEDPLPVTPMPDDENPKKTLIFGESFWGEGTW